MSGQFAVAGVFQAAEDGGFTTLARISGQNGEFVTQASISIITFNAYDLDSATPTTPTATGSLTISTVIFNELKIDKRWTVDSVGFNFATAHAATILATGSHLYRIEYKFTPTIGEVFWLVFLIRANEIFSS